MATLSDTRHLKLRRAPATAPAPCLVNPCANPQDLADVECGQQEAARLRSSAAGDVVGDAKREGAAAAGERGAGGHGGPGGATASLLLADLSPLSRRIARFVARPPRPSLPDRRAAAAAAALLTRLVPAAAVLLALPLLVWDGYPADASAWRPLPLLRHVDRVWSSLLHTSIWPVAAATCLAHALLPRGAGAVPVPGKGKGEAGRGVTRGLWPALLAHACRSAWRTSALLSLLFSTVVIANMTLHMGYPHALWNPFIWGWYRVYLPDGIAPALQGACLDVDQATATAARRQPLCLGEPAWRELSSGRLSSRNPDDVRAVQRGLDYVRRESGGIVINALARNVADGVPALRKNVEGLAPFLGGHAAGGGGTPKLAVVIFENDSDDDTRDQIKAWAEEVAASEAPSYVVDLMSCGPRNPDCQLGLMDRYDANLLTNPKASGVGKLGEFRQITLEYVLDQERYRDHSHMIILDVDLGTSLSPLGLLHTLGLDGAPARDHVVASSSSQVWPGTSGTIIPPYDLSAFRPKGTPGDARVRRMHRAFCDLMPAGDRWRNMCEACSPMQLFLIQAAADPAAHRGRAYEVGSAFNGLALYPLALLRARGARARYDAGDDGQRCEHVGFHESLGRTMYVDPKWSMNLRPSRPGGPTGFRAIKTLVTAVVGRPNVMVAIVAGNFAVFFVAVAAWWGVADGVRTLLDLPAHPRS